METKFTLEIEKISEGNYEWAVREYFSSVCSRGISDGVIKNIDELDKISEHLKQIMKERNF